MDDQQCESCLEEVLRAQKNKGFNFILKGEQESVLHYINLRT